jgi:hypothetical protein
VSSSPASPTSCIVSIGQPFPDPICKTRTFPRPLSGKSEPGHGVVDQDIDSAWSCSQLPPCSWHPCCVRHLRLDAEAAMAMPFGRGVMLMGFSVGIGLVYLLDPGRGRRHRALIRDRLSRSEHVGADALGRTRRVEPVWPKPGRVVSRPRGLEVEADGGRVTVRGTIPRADVPDLLAGIASVPGVQEVVNELDVDDEAGNMPALPGGAPPPARQPAFWWRTSSPTGRLLACSIASLLTVYGMSRRSVTGMLVALAGLGVIARVIANPGRRGPGLNDLLENGYTPPGAMRAGTR